MESPALKVVVRVEPPQLDRVTADRLMDGEISGFEKFLQERQRTQGLSGDDPLSTPERGILKAYLTYAATRST